MISLLKAPSRSGQQTVPALSQLSISVGLGSLVPVFPFLCLLARGFWPGTSWEPPGSMPQPCFLPLPVTAMPGNDSTSPEEPSLKLSRCYHPLLLQASPLLSVPDPRAPTASGKANSRLGCLFYNRFSFSRLAEQSHSCASCSCILCTSFFIPGKVLLGGCWGQALVPVAASAALVDPLSASWSTGDVFWD